MNNKNYHFIAIGGVGMSGIAKYLLQQGCKVSGSDISDNKYVTQLREMGAQIYIGHSKSNVPENSVVIISSAIKNNNPELIRARELGCKIYHRSDILAEISSSRKLFIGFAGTHGKTTTSGMCSYVLSKANEQPSFIVGGFVPELHTNGEFNKDGNIFVAELDESDGTLVKYRPNITIINNLEADHLDFYKNGLNSIIDTFHQFLSTLKPNAKVLINNDDLGNLKLKGYNFITYGLNNADYIAENINYGNGYTTFDVIHKGEILLNSIKIILPGEHNVYNTLAVIAACNEANIKVDNLIQHFETFTGMGRRFQKMLDIDSIPVYDDYAHHPTEIKATLTAMKTFTEKNVVAVFQPHRYTRLMNLWEDFKTSLSYADRIIVTDVYAASETPIENINSERFVSELEKAEYIAGSIENVAQLLLPTLNQNDIVIGLGAGTITNLAKCLKEAKEANIANRI